MISVDWIGHFWEIQMKTCTSRRDFFRAGGFAVLAGSLLKGSLPAQVQGSGGQKRSFGLGLASYTTRSFSLEQTIEMTRRVGLTHLSLKDFHLPLKATDAEIQQATAKVRDAGLTLYGVGVIYMKNADEVNRAFEYAKAAGAKTIIGVPNHDLLELVNQKAIEYDIEVAIHNHGPGDKVYPTPESAYEKIEGLDRRLGLCIDIGHTQRSGIDPAKDIERFADRVLDIHLKDVSASSGQGTTVEMGRGVIDIPAVLAAMGRIGYNRVASFEYEKDGKDPLPGLAESVGFTRGALACL